tara:strand:+ start:688 stop:966 length:279 start_codon:yes stop_codon:yes gene_type:complete
MSTLLKQTEPVARIPHDCMASDFIRESGNLRGLPFTFSEWRAVLNARDNNWKIVKGQTYIRQNVAFEGTVYTFKAIPEIHAICIKYDFYPPY